ncbi:MAG: hypothetical protein IPO47_00695 [Bacteroidetes bacterium]|nr:hypothetical protein [Bacteroidota bacterium]MBL0280042.1 hypothetical protein [Bacteroidota bacterium]
MKAYLVSILLVFTTFIYPYVLSAQAMLGYTDAQGDFYVNDGGKIIHLEPQRIISSQPAANSIAYISNSGNLTYYANHEQQKLEISNPSFYKNTDYYLYYATGGSFSVYNGTARKYLGNIQQNPFAFGDSIAAMHDFSEYFYVYENERFIELEQHPTKKIIAGDNIIAYVNHLDQFKIYYHGNKTDVDDYMPQKIAAGANIVAFIDSYNYLKVFYGGMIHELFNVTQSTCLEIPYSVEDDGIESYCNAELVYDMQNALPLFQAGDDIVAYIDDMGQFLVFDKGNIIELESQMPLHYEVVDNLLWYVDNNNYLKVYCNGELSIAETFYPEKIKADKDVIVYTDLDKRLRAFYNNESIPVSANIVIDFSLNNTTIMYNEIPNKYKFHYLR